LAIFTAYYDASGTEESGRPLVLAGLLSTERKWLRFEREWRELLTSFGVPYLHMKEYAVSQGPFRMWKGDEERRAAFLSQAIKIIKRRINLGFASYVLPEDYRAVDRLYDLRTLPDHLYAVVAVSAVSPIMDWIRQRHPGCPLLHVFEEGDRGQKVFLANLPAEIAPITSVRPAKDPLTGEWFTPFQAADLAAYELRRAIEQNLEGKPTRRKAFLELGRMLPTKLTHLNQQGLIEVCKREPILFPPRTNNAPSV
jgi:hypothetical protein